MAQFWIIEIIQKAGDYILLRLPAFFAFLMCVSSSVPENPHD